MFLYLGPCLDCYRGVTRTLMYPTFRHATGETNSEDKRIQNAQINNLLSDLCVLNTLSLFRIPWRIPLVVSLLFIHSAMLKSGGGGIMGGGGSDGDSGGGSGCGCGCDIGMTSSISIPRTCGIDFIFALSINFTSWTNNTNAVIHIERRLH